MTASHSDPTGALAPTASQEPFGLAGLEQLDRLPYLDTQTRSGMESTFGRDGTYSDHDGYLYEDSVDRVYVDLSGPGEITRIWMTAVTPADEIHIYFDGETTPRINMSALDFFSGTVPPFRNPLVLNDSQSSGGWVCYLPMLFNKSVRVALKKRDGMAVYVQVNVRQFSPDTTVSTWTSSESGNQNSTAVRELWSNPSIDPKPPVTATETVTGTVTVPAGGSSTLLDLAGPRSISSLRLKLPAITSTSTELTDDGRAFGADGYSKFTVAIDAANTGVTLTRRFDYGVGNQKAEVYVDGELAGQWFDEGRTSGSEYDQYVHWKDSTFTIPARITAGKTSITVQVSFVSSDIDWNEFRYWVHSTVNGSPIQTDMLDVFDAASEASHSYEITGSSWEGGPKTFYYPYDDAIAKLLNQLGIQITWDGSASPAVEAPLGSFFAIGNYGFCRAPQTLMVGVDDTGWLYMYFPMPFARNAIIKVTNSGASVSGVEFEIKHIAQSGSFDNVGHFTTEYRSQSVDALFRHDVDIINRHGQGTIVGFVMSALGAPEPYAVARSYPEGYPPLGAYQVGYYGYVEGDEKFYIDGNRTPAHGTGVEDFANAGFGWNRGFLATPTHGYSTYRATKVDETNWVNQMSFQRILLEDRVNFTNHIRMSLEHGLVNDFGIDQLDTLLYYYSKPTLRTVRTDLIDVGVPASETAHSFATSGATTSATNTYSFEGDYRDVYYTDEGKVVSGYSEFKMAIKPANAGMLIRNRFDQTYLIQEAQVSVDGVSVGTWRAIGGNSSESKWKETDFLLPAGATSGKSSITIRLTKTPGSEPLSQYQLSVYSILTGPGDPAPGAPGATVNITNPDFESGDLRGWTPTGSAFTNAQVVDLVSQDDVPFNQHGTYHLWGYGGGAEDVATGSMRTPDFLLGGDGKISFLIAGGRDIVNLNLALVRAADEKVLLSATGWDYEGYKPVIMDAGEWVGTLVYLKATDTAVGGWGHLNLDHFQVPVAAPKPPLSE